MIGMKQAALAAILGATLVACGPPPLEGTEPFGAQGPQFAPDDPCKGVVPQLCASPQPIVSRTPGSN